MNIKRAVESKRSLGFTRWKRLGMEGCEEEFLKCVSEQLTDRVQLPEWA